MRPIVAPDVGAAVYSTSRNFVVALRAEVGPSDAAQRIGLGAEDSPRRPDRCAKRCERDEPANSHAEGSQQSWCDKQKLPRCGCQSRLAFVLPEGLAIPQNRPTQIQALDQSTRLESTTNVCSLFKRACSASTGRFAKIGRRPASFPSAVRRTATMQHWLSFPSQRRIRC